MKKEERINVKIVKLTGGCWYKVGEVHNVGNYITFDFKCGEPMFEVNNGYRGIEVSDCVILPPKKKMTLSEIESKLGYAIEIIEELK